MRNLSLVRAFVVVGVCSGLVATCSDPKSTIPTSPTGLDVTSVSISGPATIAPGQSGQFTVALRFSDGTVKSAIGGNVAWRSSSTFLLPINASGLATARQQSSGEAVLTADIVRPTTNSVRTATREIVIVPDGTYRLVGVVNDAEFPTVPVAGAKVTATPGSVSTTTNSLGQYKLYGVPPDAEIRITADGYLPVVQNVQLVAHATRNFQMALPGPRVNLAGNYRLAIDVVGACSSSPALSVDLQHRRYDAVITQTEPALDVMLTEPIFRMNSTSRGNRFTGQAGAAGAIFTLESYYSYYYPYYGAIGYPNVAERLSNGTFLVVDGRAVTTGSAAGLTGTMSGGLANYDPRFPNQAFFLGGCFSSALQFTLTPR
jgi:carboxypeptidase family protein